MRHSHRVLPSALVQFLRVRAGVYYKLSSGWALNPEEVSDHCHLHFMCKGSRHGQSPDDQFALMAKAGVNA